MTKEHPIAMHEQMISDLQTDYKDHEERISLLEKNDVRTQEQTKNLYTTMGRIEQMIADIKGSLTTMATTVDEKLEKTILQFTAALEKLDGRVKGLEQANGKKWEKIVWLFIGAAVALAGNLIIRGLLK